MAVDSRNKRFSLMGIDLPFVSVYPNPDGTISAEDRQQFLGKYHGISFTSPAAGGVLHNLPLMGVG